MSQLATTAPRPHVAPPAQRRHVGRAVLDFARAHPVLAVFLVAVVARFLLAVVVTLTIGDGVFSDDATYSQMAAERAAGHTARWDDYNWWLYSTTATFLVPLTALYKVVGPVPLAGRLLVGLFGSITAAVTARVALEVVPKRWAVGAGLAVALLPSQVLFSSLVLKDALVWAVLAGLALVAAVMGRSTGRMLLLMLLSGGVLLGLLVHLRLHTLVVAAWAFAIAALFGAREGRVVRVTGAAALLIAVPLWAGAGIAGLGLVSDQQGTLEQKRLANAQGADTAFVPRPTATPGASAPAGRGSGQANPGALSDGGSDFSGVGRGLRAIALDPLPWQTATNSRVALARIESIIAWWPLLALAVVGVATSLRERAHRRNRLRVLAFPVLAGGAIALMYGLSEGNFGTAYRHRGEFVWAVVLLAVVGGHRIAEIVASRRRRRDAPLSPVGS